MARHWTEDFVREFPYADPPRLLDGKEAPRSYLGEALSLFSLELTVTDAYECPSGNVVIAEHVSEGRPITTGKACASRHVGVFGLRGDRGCRQRELHNPKIAAHVLSPAWPSPAVVVDVFVGVLGERAP